MLLHFILLTNISIKDTQFLFLLFKNYEAIKTKKLQKKLTNNFFSKRVCIRTKKFKINNNCLNNSKYMET